MKEIRCQRCGRLLFKGAFDTIEIKCHRCKKINTFTNSEKEGQNYAEEFQKDWKKLQMA
jgi:phage FluMu protein Com